AVALAPGIIVMIVHLVDDRAADETAHALDHPFAPGVGVFARERHAGQIFLPQLAVLLQHRRIDVDAVLAAGELEEGGRGLVAEPARAEVYADPNRSFLVGEQIAVVVARADRAELIARHGLEMLDLRAVLPQRAVEQRMLDPLGVAAPE